MTDLYKPSANPQDNIRHGIVSSITDDQLKDLVEYVNSL
jgi:hypothetical protein